MNIRNVMEQYTVSCLIYLLIVSLSLLEHNLLKSLFIFHGRLINV